MLTDREIRAAKPRDDDKAYSLFDEKGLYLDILPSGVKAFRLKVYVNGIEKRCSLGTYDARGDKSVRKAVRAARDANAKCDLGVWAVEPITLAEAREKRDAVRKLADNGIWVVDRRRQMRQESDDKAADAKANRFGMWAEAYFRHHASGWSANHSRDIRRMLDADIIPELGKIPGPTLTTAHVQALVDKIAARGAVTYAHDVRTYCSAIFKHANKKRPVKLENPVAYVDVQKPPKAERHPALPHDQIGAFLRDLQFVVGEPVTRIAMRLLMHTALRTSELRLGRWSEIDEKTREWRIPESRTKTDLPHIVPLSDEVMVLLAQLRRISGGGALMFPNVLDPDEAMSDSTLLALLYRMKLKGKQSGHGCRRQFSTWANRHKHNADAIERQLGHTERNKVRESYNEYDFIDERKAMMTAWSAWLATQEHEASNVIELRVA